MLYLIVVLIYSLIVKTTAPYEEEEELGIISEKPNQIYTELGIISEYPIRSTPS